MQANVRSIDHAYRAAAPVSLDRRDAEEQRVKATDKGWIRLYGLLCMEVLQQIDFAITDASPLFEEYLTEFCDWLGSDYEADPATLPR